MKYIITALAILFITGITYAQDIDTAHWPFPVQRLIKAYPDNISSFDGTNIIMKDGRTVQYNEGGHKTHQQLINSNDIGDIFTYPYIKGKVKDIEKGYDPGRIRSEELLRKMYGSTSAEVQNDLVTISWCPKLVGQKLKVTKINGVAKQLQKVSDELDEHPELRDYLYSSETFNWRKVRGSGRLSAHSFGIAIDLNTKYSNYWQWDCRCTSEDTDLGYKNRIPQLIVDIFEKHGFIWGGKWYHYDTMHFEYRPELLIK
ncbi:M15 family peptidase [Dysgonomonas sp. 521]|uniref:M15 family metallopeptidase n=1 Tax=Dysgonomonas sp. 521 TaxID=2302932 RepID=UPI0013D7CFC7|nr:M15 family metallopeptidase [Dysgonomonas sp. 521]NDV95808.1 M15 family peptidase [Dysgonomonas sp. 521]